MPHIQIYRPSYPKYLFKFFGNNAKSAIVNYFCVEPEAKQSSDKEDSPGREPCQYESKIISGVYSIQSTAEALRYYEKVYHPVTGSLKSIFESSDRIIRSPLRLQVWNEDEIHLNGRVVVIGDAARVLPPYSGQGQ